MYRGMARQGDGERMTGPDVSTPLVDACNFKPHCKIGITSVVFASSCDKIVLNYLLIHFCMNNS